MSTDHMSAWNDKGWGVFNPNGVSVENLPVIYGFNNGGNPGWLTGVLLAGSGDFLGAHICSSEGWMLHDLGIIEGARPDRHESFRSHYPDGYRMEFVSHEEVAAHVALMAAIEKAHSKEPKS